MTAAAPAQTEPSPIQAELNEIHALALNPQDTAPREGDAFTVALLRQLLSRLPAPAILASGAAEGEARLRLVAAILKYVGDEVGGEIGTDIEVMDPARVLREAEAAVNG